LRIGRGCAANVVAANVYRGLFLTGSLGLFVSLSACAGGERTEALEAGLATSTDLTVDTSVRYQRITGFGASSAWTGGSISEAWADTFFSPERGLGLSLLRVHIAPNGTTVETLTAQRAVARGASVWAAPWSPPGAWKTSGTDNHGGSLLPEHYQDWADRLAAFSVAMKAKGVPLIALSAQNEPNWSAEWETCVYTPDELVTFVGQYLGPTLARESPDTQLIAPETIDWNTLEQFAEPLLADPAARDALSVIAVHAYGGVPYPYTAPAEAGKEFWETEVSYDSDSSFQAALETARQVQRHLMAGVNAFHYWWLLSDTTGGLMRGGELEPQAYGLGHYSKFVRPGYVRVDVPAAPQPGVSSSAYYDPESHRTVLVLVNETTSELSSSLHLDGVSPVQVRPWVTSAEESLAAHPPLPFANPFDYAFAPQSVTSLVFSETLEATGAGGEGGEGGAPAADGGAGGEPSTDGTSSAGAPDDGEPNGTGGAASADGDPAANGGGTDSAAPSEPDLTTIAPPKRGAYAACAMSRTTGPAPLTPLVAYVLLALQRRRQRIHRR
jgi:glucuronoarabinoxylan endo-1,4-beta-xylanase